MSVVTRQWIECDSCESMTEFRGMSIPVEGWAIAHGEWHTWEAWVCPTCVPGFKSLDEAANSTGKRNRPGGIDRRRSRDPYATKGGAS